MSEIVSINIESTDLRFLVSDGPRIKRWGSVPLQPNVVREGQVLNPQALSAVVNELILSKRVSKGKGLVSLSGIQSVHRTIALPRMPRNLLGAAIVAEAKREMPLSTEQIYLSWHPVSEKKAEVQRFFLLGTPRNMLDAEVACLRSTGLDPRWMNLKPVALAQMVNRANALIIDIEPESCTIVVVMHGIPAIMRSVIMPLDYPVQDRAHHVLQEFERTLQFYESTYVDSPLNDQIPLFLTGSLAGYSKVSQLIASGTKYQVERLPPPLKCPPDFPLHQYAVNVGLALGRGKLAISRPAVQNGRFLVSNLNILPETYRPKRPSAGQVLALAGAVAGVVSIVVLYRQADSAAAETSLLQKESKRLQQEVTIRQARSKQLDQQIQETKKAVELTRSKHQGVLDISNSLGQLQSRRQRSYDALDVAVKLLSRGPEGQAMLSAIMLDDDVITLDGKVPFVSAADEEASYAAYRLALDYAGDLRQQTGWFSDVRVDLVTRSAMPEEVKFKLTLRISGLSSTEKAVPPAPKK